MAIREVLNLISSDRYTNYGSQKAHQISENPQAALLFYWGPLNRQVPLNFRHILFTSHDD